MRQPQPAHAAFFLSLAVAVWLPSTVAAQQKGTFQAAVSTPAGPATNPTNTGYLEAGIDPLQIVPGDFNGDGKQDFVAGVDCGNGSIAGCPIANDAIVTYLGNGDGTFQPAIFSAGPAQGIRSIAVGDFNGDGKMDVAAVSDCTNMDCSSGTLTIMLGNGDGTFTAGATYGFPGAAIGANTVAVGDLNGDGKQDIVVALGCYFPTGGCSQGAVLVFLGNGDGTFQAPLNFLTIGNSTLPVVIGDFNKDGKPDVLLTGPNALVFFPGNGDGTLGTSILTSLPTGFGGQGLAAADFNSDGNLDAVTGGTNAAAVLFGNGDGTFQSSVVYPLGITAEEFPNSIMVADMNGDGKPDIIVGDGQNGIVGDVAGVLLNDGMGNFTNIANYSMSGPYQASIAVADFNGDGKNDILLTSMFHAQNSSDGTINLLLGNGDGTFRSVQYVSTAGIGAGTGSVAAADFNGDGFQDLIVPIPSGFALFLSDGAGGYQGPATFTSSSTTVGEMVAVGDFNKDGKPDVAVVSNCGDGACSQDAVSIFSNTGNGTFANPLVYEVGGTSPQAIATGDFNGDGNLDIALLEYDLSGDGQGRIGILLGNGDGTFQPAITTPLSGPVYWLAAADLNHDGRTDIVVSQDSGNVSDPHAQSVQILLSNGDGTFSSGGDYLTGGDGAPAQGPGGFGSTVAIGDVNGDGIPDIVAADSCDSIVSDAGCAQGEIGVLLGNGDGTFQAAKTIIAPDATFDGISLADVNADGKLDVVASVGSGIVVFLGNGDGTFKSPTAYSGGATVQNSQLAIADLRNDGGFDVVQGDYLVGLTIFCDQGFALPSTTTSVQSSLNPSVYGESVTFTATVTSSSGTPSGAVKFNDGGQGIGGANLSGGSGSLTVSTLAVGTHSIVASYGGDGEHGPSNSAALSQVVSQATTSTALTSSANPSYVSQSVTFTATVSPQYGGAVSGTVTFKQGATTLAIMAVSSGRVAQYSTTYTTTGVRALTATYSGDSNNAGSTSATFKQTVSALPAATTTTVKTSGSPSFVNQPVMFTASVTSTFGPIPDGEQVTFSDGTTTLASAPLTGGSASYTTSTLKAATHVIKAAYAGDATFKASSGTVKQVVSLYPTTTTLSSNLNPSTYGQSVTLTATVTSAAPGGATGTVTFKNGSATLGTGTLSGGMASLSTTKLPAGVLSLTANYNGDTQSAKSSGGAAQTVNQATTTTTLTSSLNPSNQGQVVRFTATVTSPTATPTGTVTFMDGTSTLGTANVASGKATLPISTLAAGSHNITAMYNGTANIIGSTSSVLVQTVN